MNNLSGISIPSFPYNIKFIGTLLFAEYPTTLIYCTEEGSPVVKEWVDCSENGDTNRFFIYLVQKKHLKQFLEGKITHIDLISTSIENYVIFQDVKEEKIINNVIISVDKIPYNYKPASDFTFSKEDGVDLQKINDFFNLTEIDIEENIISVKEIISKESSEAIYFHLKSGKGIGLGRIDTEVYAKTLLSFNRLYKSVALDQLKGSNRGDIDINAKKYEELNESANIELFGQSIAASYGFFIRPTHIQSTIFGETDSENFASRVLKLITNSKQKEMLSEEYLLHSGFTLKMYKEFLEEIYRLRLKLDINWYNPVKEKEITSNLDFVNANRIIGDIKNLSIKKSSKFTAVGKFRAVNCDTGHFTFTNTTEEQYSGYFEKGIRESIPIINFITIYEVHISRETIKEPGKIDETDTDTITAYYRDVE